MKIFILAIILISQINLFAQQHVEISVDGQKEKGFLQFKETYKGYSIIALSHDVCSAGPSQDLRIYISDNSKNYTNFLHIPLQTRKGFKCIRKQKNLSIYLIDNWEEVPTKLFLTLNLDQLTLKNKKP